MYFPKILAMVMAGGEGSRLSPLTAQRSKPAVPFAGRYRIVDFVLSNLVNSDIHSIYLLVQYKSQSLIDHVSRAWVLSQVIPGQFVAVVPPQMREGPAWFQGTADAVYQNRNLIVQNHPGLVAVFGADHIYRMDIRQMAQFHVERGAQLTVAALPVPLAQARSFGIIEAERDGRVVAFREKPAEPPPMPGRPDMAFASMGNYLFDTDLLLDALDATRRRGDSDFGHHVLPNLIGNAQVFAYDFAQNQVPGVRDYEEPAYWRDVGTIDAYYEANMDTLGVPPRLNLFNPLWFINSSSYQGPVPRIAKGNIVNSTIGAGTLMLGGTLRNSIVRREVQIEEGAEIEDSIIMDCVTIRRGARLRRVIIDRYNEIRAGDQIGFDADRDRQRFHVTDSGLTVLPKCSQRSSQFRYE
jgi:glucose-1-phosphate adenylyltransferase